MLCGVRFDRRLLLLAGAVAAAAVVAVVLIVVSNSGSSKSSTPTTATTSTPTSTGSGPTGVKAIFAGVPQHGDTLGKATAPVTMLVFEDPQCPYCREWNVNTLPAVVDQFVRTGQIKIAYRGIEIISAQSVPALSAIYAAGNQGKLWDMNAAVYDKQGIENSGWITTSLLRSTAKTAGVDADAMLKASSSPAVKKALVQAATEARQDAVQGTPTFVLLRPPALPVQLQVSSLEPAGFTATLAAALG